MKRSKFSLSHYHLTTMQMGRLVPVGCYEVLPGDTVQQATSCLVRCSPLVAPPMHPVHVRLHHWFVPYRLVWDNWEKFITGGPDGMDESEYPTCGFEGIAAGDLVNYLGAPVFDAGPGISVSALPIRAYNLIFNEWYRDQDLTTERPISKADGFDTMTVTDLALSAWEKDYFTTSRPWEVKGPQVTVPLGTSAPIDAAFVEAGATPGNRTVIRNAGTGGAQLLVQEAGTLSAQINIEGIADLSGASAVSINVLREALALQRFEEARARYGSRYTEYLRYLGVKSSDARLQRPEYLGGGKQTIQFSEVLSTNFTPDTLNPGQFGGHGIAAMRSNRYRRFFEEHGVVISLITIRPKTIYANSLHRMWNRRTKEDFWQRELQHIGQQPVLLKEVMANVEPGDGAGQQDFTFGFQDRYDEYRRCESRISGDFATTELDMWHFARNFADPITLNNTFVQCDPSVLPFADQTGNNVYVMANHSIQARRLVSQRGNSMTF